MPFPEQNTLKMQFCLSSNNITWTSSVRVLRARRTTTGLWLGTTHMDTAYEGGCAVRSGVWVAIARGWLDCCRTMNEVIYSHRAGENIKGSDLSPISRLPWILSNATDKTAKIAHNFALFSLTPRQFRLGSQWMNDLWRDKPFQTKRSILKCTERYDVPPLSKGMGRINPGG